MLLRRFLSFSTTLNPSRLSVCPHHLSVLLLTTPSQLSNSIEHASVIVKSTSTTAVVACIDTILGHRNAVSQLWFRNPIQISSYLPLPEDIDNNRGLKSSFSDAAPVQLDKNWKDTSKSTQLLIGFGSHSIQVNLANTLFSNGEQSTCFFIQPNNHPGNWINLAEISIQLPMDEHADEDYSITNLNKLKELAFEDTNNPTASLYQISSYTSNMIETINDRPAADYLINNRKIQKTKKELYLQLINQTQPEKARPFSSLKRSPNNDMYQLVVGGLGWGEKQGMIVLDPAVGEVGHRYCRLYQYDPSKSIQQVKSTEGQVKLRVQCSEPESGYHDYDQQDSPVPIDGVAGLGSESGFLMDGVWHKCRGEVNEVAIKQNNKD
ncbi:hypothetical protein FOA43_002691 [Brettanomyces nanus]|uniref:Uncharacterized protein n=1 Tax=Eeniella nana TaxID=13502 RepID=A0A875S308_EENNA|nr:uncharacterized protein FOA43_002691 [Brettanomyces nanus]QPG75338.1 hypothetical protein FOA43_002691 [Brettanomyces nanus]